MIEIKDLLTKFDLLLTSEVVKKATIRDVLKKVLGVEIQINDIKIKNGTVYLAIKSIYKNEIVIRRKEIDSLLTEALGNKAPKDIR